MSLSQCCRKKHFADWRVSSWNDIPLALVGGNQVMAAAHNIYDPLLEKKALVVVIFSEDGRVAAHFYWRWLPQAILG